MLLIILLFSITEIHLLAGTVQLENTKNYTLQNFELPETLKKEIPREKVTFSRAKFYWKEPGKTRPHIYDPTKRTYMARLNVTNRTLPWILVSKKPGFQASQLIVAGRIHGGLSLNIINDKNPINNFAVVDLDIKASEDNDWQFVYLVTIWDPENGIYNDEFQNALCNWLQEMGYTKESCPAYFPQKATSKRKKPDVTEETSKLIIPQLLEELAQTLASLSDALKK